MEANILGPSEQKWRTAVKEQLIALRSSFARFHSRPEDEAMLADSLRQLEELFLLVVVGEFNSGKSVFVNALLGEPVVEEGVVPTTSRIQLLKYGEAGARTSIDEATVVITAPVPLLRDINIVDTPGTNAIDRRHEAITVDFVPRADLVLFVTSADRPFTESERAFLAGIRDWGKKIVVIVNKIDILELPEEVERVESFVAENARALLGVTPEVFPVAARIAFRAKTGIESAGNGRSRFDALESYIREILDQAERVRLKLLNPLGVGERLIATYLAGVEKEAQVLRADITVIDEIEGQITVYEQDMNRGFELRMADVDNVLHQLELRGHEFIEDSVRLARVFDLLDKPRMREQFERKVVADAPEEIERRVGDIIDWLVSSDLKQWQAVKAHLERRRSESSSRMLGEINPQFEYDRSHLMETVGRAAQRTLEGYDKRAEAERMAEGVQNAVANTAMLEVGAVGLGAAVAMIASSTAADVTGILAAGLLAALGFLVIPQRRRKAKKELREKIGALRGQLMSALTAQFQREVKRSTERLRGSIAPYARFVRAEEMKLGQQSEELKGIREAMGRVRLDIEASRAD